MKCLKPVYNAVFYFLLIFVGWAVRLLFPLRVFGRQHLPKGNTPFVLAPNHLRAIDPMYIILARWIKKKMLVMGKQELFGKNPLLDFCWNVFGAFPIERGAGNMALLDEVEREVKKGRGLLLFPEGTRSKDGSLGKLKSGAFVVAMRASAPIVPCRIRYSAGKPKLFRRISVAFGPPVTLEQLGLVGEYSPKKLREAKRIYTGVLEDLYAQYADRM